MLARRALITGITGQDGAYLGSFLINNGYQVFGLVRRSSTSEVNDFRLRWLGIIDRVQILDGDVTDLSSVIRVLRSTPAGRRGIAYDLS